VFMPGNGELGNDCQLPGIVADYTRIGPSGLPIKTGHPLDWPYKLYPFGHERRKTP